MIALAVTRLSPGMRLAKTVYYPGGRRVLAPRGPVTQRTIDRLRTWGFTTVYVQHPLAPDVAVDDVIAEQTRQEALRVTRNVIDRIVNKQGAQLDEMRKVLTSILDDLLRRRDVLVHLSDLRAANQLLVGHSVNVCVLSLMTGLTLGYDRCLLDVLGEGALLHDVGKAFIPDEIWFKRGPLDHDDWAAIRQHPILGASALEGCSSLSPTTRIIALQHHERMDGTGYPHRLAGRHIHPWARIVQVADVYDALTSDRPYRPRPLSSPAAVAEMVRYRGAHHDPQMLDAFLENIAPVPVGTVVCLSDGRSGIVVGHRRANSLPAVRVLWDRGGRALRRPRDVDLNLSPLRIIQVEDVAWDGLDGLPALRLRSASRRMGWPLSFDGPRRQPLHELALDQEVNIPMRP